jgi:hypothetical protein
VTDGERRTLRALTAQLVPGPPEDEDPGALELGAPEAIERLLSAFEHDEPPIHAAREGGFIPLDAVAELGWRIRIEGSRGLPEREFAGPVTGLAETVAAGLRQLDARCRDTFGVAFADAKATDQDAVLDGADDELAAFVRLALGLTLDAVYGSPHYGGNPGGAAWRPLRWPGFTEPIGFTAAEVSEPDPEPAGSGAGAGAAPGAQGPSASEAVSELRANLPEGAGWESSGG